MRPMTLALLVTMSASSASLALGAETWESVRRDGVKGLIAKCGVHNVHDNKSVPKVSMTILIKFPKPGNKIVEYKFNAEVGSSPFYGYPASHHEFFLSRAFNAPDDLYKKQVFDLAKEGVDKAVTKKISKLEFLSNAEDLHITLVGKQKEEHYVSLCKYEYVR